MATVEEDSNRDLTCSICFSLFKVPTTLMCGHTFCRGCLDKFWSQPTGHGKGFTCPICKKTYKTKPPLNKSTIIAALVEKLRAAGGADREDSCQDCAGERVGTRLCLVCGDQQYCAAHLSPHRRGDHLLLRPLGAEVSWPCRGHLRAMEFYCPVHAVPVCRECTSQQHASCQPALLLPLLKTTLDNRDQRLKDIAGDIDKKEQAILKRKNEKRHIQKSVDELKNRLGTEFSEIKKYIKQQEGATWERIGHVQKGVEQKINESIGILTNELAEQKEMKRCLEKSTEDNWLELLKNPPSAKDISSASTSPVEDFSLDNDEFASLSAAVIELKRVIFENPVILAVNPAVQLEGVASGDNQDEMMCSPSPPTSSPLVANGGLAASLECPLYVRPNEFVQCAVPVTFDPNTVSCYLGLANENTKVMVSKNKMRYPASPDRFISNQVLCAEGFSEGCHYWEIEVKDCEGWAVGITYKNIRKTDILGRTAASWCLEWSDKSLSAWHANQKIQITQPRSQMIGIFLNCETHELSFHSVADNFSLLHTFKDNFSHPVFPAFWLYGSKEGGSLTITPIVKN